MKLYVGYVNSLRKLWSIALAVLRPCLYVELVVCYVTSKVAMKFTDQTKILQSLSKYVRLNLHVVE